MTGPSFALARYDEACRALADAKTLDEVRGISDKSAALQEYYRRAGNRQLELDAAELRLRAERRAGELLIEIRDTVGFAKGGRPRAQPDGKTASAAEAVNGPVRLADIGIDHKFSARAQKAAGIASVAYEAMLARWREREAVAAGRVSLDLVRGADKAQRRAEREAELGAKILALPDRKYGVIYADPEWRFEPRSRETGMDRLPDNHYPTTATEDLCRRPVSEIAFDDCALFLWATPPMLDDAFVVMNAWEFSYVTSIVWKKVYPGDQLGTGYWFRFEHEMLLLGTRGKVPCPAPGKQWKSVIEAPVGAHSQKPAIFRELIDAYFPTLPKIELNAWLRDGEAPPQGWDLWGLDAGPTGPDASHPEASSGRGEAAEPRVDPRAEEGD